MANPVSSAPRKNNIVKRDKIKSRVCNNGQQKRNRTSLRIRTEVHSSVSISYSHEDDSSDFEVDESLKKMSKKELLKYVANMEGRLSAVEKIVKPVKVSDDDHVADPHVEKIVKQDKVSADDDVEKIVKPDPPVQKPDVSITNEPMEEDFADPPVDRPDADVENPSVCISNDSMEEDVADANILIQLSGNAEKPNICTTKDTMEEDVVDATILFELSGNFEDQKVWLILKTLFTYINILS